MTGRSTAVGLASSQVICTNWIRHLCLSLVAVLGECWNNKNKDHVQ